jgi:hypothetical protein
LPNSLVAETCATKVDYKPTILDFAKIIRGAVLDFVKIIRDAVPIHGGGDK